jgi:hypothetical protein
MTGLINGEVCSIIDIENDGINFWVSYIDPLGNIKLDRNFQGIQNVNSAYVEGDTVGVFKPSKDGSNNPLVTNLILSAGSYVTSALPQGTTQRLVWTGVGPFAYKTGTSAMTPATATDIKVIAGVIETQSFGTDTHISVYGIGPGYCNITGGAGG